MSRFANRREAFWQGIRDALGAPVLVLFAGMVGFGAMGRSHGFDAWMTGLTSLLMFALPGQVVMLEMFISGSSLLAIGFAVTLTSTRFVTMVVTLFPQLHRRDRNPLLYLWVHMLAMTAWAVSMREFPRMRPQHRLNYFLGLALPCWLISPMGTVLGYFCGGLGASCGDLEFGVHQPLVFLAHLHRCEALGQPHRHWLGLCLGACFLCVGCRQQFVVDRGGGRFVGLLD